VSATWLLAQETNWIISISPPNQFRSFTAHVILNIPPFTPSLMVGVWRLRYRHLSLHFLRVNLCRHGVSRPCIAVATYMHQNVPNFQIPNIQQFSLLSKVGKVNFVGSFGKRCSFWGIFLYNVERNKTTRGNVFSFGLMTMSEKSFELGTWYLVWR